MTLSEQNRRALCLLDEWQAERLQLRRVTSEGYADPLYVAVEYVWSYATMQLAKDDVSETFRMNLHWALDTIYAELERAEEESGVSENKMPDTIIAIVDLQNRRTWLEPHERTYGDKAWAHYTRDGTAPVPDSTPIPAEIREAIQVALNEMIDSPASMYEVEFAENALDWLDKQTAVPVYPRTTASDSSNPKPAATVPDITQEDAQVVELVRLAREDIDKTDDAYKFNVYLIIGLDKIQIMDRGKYVDLSDAITELRSRLAPKPPQRPTNQEWFDIATAPVTLEAKWEAMKLLRDQHLAADKWDAAQGGEDED